MNSGGNGNHSDVFYFHILPSVKLLDQKILMPSINIAGSSGIGTFLLQTFPASSHFLFLAKTFQYPPITVFLSCTQQYLFFFPNSVLSLCYPNFSFNCLSHNLVPSSFVCPLICQKHKMLHICGNSICTQKENTVSSILKKNFQLVAKETDEVCMHVHIQFPFVASET